MERVLELLADESPQNLRAAVKLLTVDTLANCTDQTKHKLKTKISSLLKSSGSKRAYGAVLARLALQDWSVVKSHGGSWTVIMLHVLDLPDQVCWKPITKTLTDLFVKVHGKADLSRDVIGGSKIGDFVKRLVATLSFTHFYSAATKMLEYYPTQCRPYIDKLLPILRNSRANEYASEAIASTCVSEKQSVEVWQTRVRETVEAVEANIKSEASDELELVNDMQQLASYIKIAARIRAKVPSQRIAVLLAKMLSSLKPVAALEACKFIRSTFSLLVTFYVQNFDNYIHNLAECFDLGQKQAIAAAHVIFLQVKSIGWASEKYAPTFSRLQKRVLKFLENQYKPLGVDSLADYVQNPGSFKKSTLNASDIDTLTSFLTAVSINVPGLPQSLRIQSDCAILKYGNDRDLVRATLYPSKYSILPLTIDRIPTLDGFEALVHPRFPPLNISKYNLANPIVPEEDDHREETVLNGAEPELDNTNNTVAPVTDIPTTDRIEVDEEIAVEHQNSVESLPKIPESTIPKRRVELETPPEKRTKVDSQIPEVTEVVSVLTEEKNNDSEDDDDDLVIPVLNMDSD